MYDNLEISALIFPRVRTAYRHEIKNEYSPKIQGEHINRGKIYLFSEIFLSR